MEKLDDELKILWLMAKYGTTNVLKIMAAMRTVPASLTEIRQRSMCAAW